MRMGLGWHFCYGLQKDRIQWLAEAAPPSPDTSSQEELKQHPSYRD